MVENVLTSSEDRFDRQCKIAVPVTKLLEKFHNVVLAGGQSMVITNPYDSCAKSFIQNVIGLANGLKAPEFIVKFLDIFSAGGNVDFSDLGLNASDGLS